jgi:signal transduction histidine kinase
MTDGIVVFDAQGRILHTNCAFTRLWGMQVQPTFATLLPTARAERVALRDEQGHPLPYEQWPSSRILHGEVLGDGATSEILTTVLTGEDKFLSASGAPLRSAEGQIIGGVAVFRDVTERRQLEHEHLRLLNVVSHELRSPLTVLEMGMQFQRRRLEHGVSPTVEDCHRMETSIDRMTRLIDDLLDMAWAENHTLTLHRERCDLREMCDEIVVEQRVASGREIVAELPSAPVLAEVDCLRIGQVLTNLLTNAIKYSAADRPVTLRLRVQEGQDDGQQDDGQQGGVVRLEVQDEGPGIAPEYQTRLFKAFSRVPGIEARAGAGVSLGSGLYVSKALVEQHGGQIGVESQSRDGATFWCTVPLGAPATTDRAGAD